MGRVPSLWLRYLNNNKNAYIITTEGRISVDTDAAIPKSTTLFTAENLIIAAVGYGITLAYSYIIHVNETYPSGRIDLELDLPDFKLFYEMIATHYGIVSVYPIDHSILYQLVILLNIHSLVRGGTGEI